MTEWGAALFTNFVKGAGFSLCAYGGVPAGIEMDRNLLPEKLMDGNKNPHP
jgi:hypothetical protein